jgi:hypothetical protein
MKKMLIAAALVLGLSATAKADYTMYRPIDACLWSFCHSTPLSHTYTMYDSWACIEQFGGGCDCNGHSDCYYSEHGNAGTACPNSWFNHWTYAINGVCHNATNNEAWYINGGNPGVMRSGQAGYVGGFGFSVGAFGNWGTDGGC